MSIRAEVDLSRCQGYGNCLLAAPDIFDLDDVTGLAVVLQEHPPEELREAAQAAARNCPVTAITIVDESA